MKNKVKTIPVFLVAAVLAICLELLVFLPACVSPLNIGGEGQPCSSKGACLDGLICNSNNVCERAGGRDGGGDAAADSGDDGGTDASVDASEDASDASTDGGNDAGSDASSEDGSADSGVDGGFDGGWEQCKGKPDFTGCELPDAGYRYNICISETCVMPGCGDTSCNPPGPNFPVVPVTGPHYTRDTSNILQPVVYDTVTGLYWQGCAGGAFGNDCGQSGAVARQWAEALGYCNSLTWGKYGDWRLPDYHELHSIIDYAKTYPAIDKTAFPNTPNATFWSSSTGPDNPVFAWSVLFSYASTSRITKDFEAYARCVRGSGSTLPPPRYTKSFPKADQPLVFDVVTGLTWQGCVSDSTGGGCLDGSPRKMTASEAQSHCDTLDWGGYSSGWRMPTVKELLSLVSNRIYYPATDADAFPGTPPETFWAAPAVKTWTVDFYYGSVYENDKDLTFVARCVRDGK